MTYILILTSFQTFYSINYGAIKHKVNTYNKYWQILININ